MSSIAASATASEVLVSVEPISSAVAADSTAALRRNLELKRWNRMHTLKAAKDLLRQAVIAKAAFEASPEDPDVIQTKDWVVVAFPLAVEKFHVADGRLMRAARLVVGGEVALPEFDEFQTGLREAALADAAQCDGDDAANNIPLGCGCGSAGA